MAKSTDVIILGSGFRGLWLATELVKLGWKVSWFQLGAPKTNKQKGGFQFDDWPLQVGAIRSHSRLVAQVREFVEQVLEPHVQDVAVQVLTPNGPLELSGGGEEYGLKKFFPKSWAPLKSYLVGLEQSSSMEEAKGRQFLHAHAKKIFERPLGERWILEWLGSLRRPRAVSTRDWIISWSKEVLNPKDPLWIFRNSLEDVCSKAMAWAQKQGVDVRSHERVADVSVDGAYAKGVEILGGEGFLEAKYLVTACSHQKILSRLPTLGQRLKSPVKPNSEKWVWVRCGFLLKSQTRPQGLLEFSSFVIDPHMPLVEGNMGFLKWTVTEQNDHLTVWVRVPYGELKRRSYLMELTESLQKSLDRLFPLFSKNLGAVLPFEEYFHSPDVGHDDLAIVFDGNNDFGDLKSKLKNVWTMGPGQDRGLEVLSALATEYRLLQKMTLIRQKELKKSDRKIHPARNGPGMVRTK